tara:strand:+ start:11964 stop:12758 length:795 start_codon:yes stop_codon:yes gene_type:complete
MPKIKQSTLLVLALNSGLALAGTMGPTDNFTHSPYVKLGSGGSYSMKAGISPDHQTWDTSPQGYNADVGNTALYSAAFGYHISSLLSGDIQYIYRPSYNYEKYQTSSAAGTANFSGNKTRYFDLQSNSLMANAYLHGREYPGILNRALGQGFFVEPFIGGGLGVAFNTVSNFHSVSQTRSGVNRGPVVAMILDHERTSLAYQFSAGLNLYNNTHFNLGAGYRYYNGGVFTSENYLIEHQITVPPWKGTLQANEFFIDLMYKFNA